jgi:hypothetical protein
MPEWAVERKARERRRRKSENTKKYGPIWDRSFAQSKRKPWNNSARNKKANCSRKYGEGGGCW